MNICFIVVVLSDPSPFTRSVIYVFYVISGKWHLKIGRIISIFENTILYNFFYYNNDEVQNHANNTISCMKLNIDSCNTLCVLFLFPDFQLKRVIQIFIMGFLY